MSKPTYFKFYDGYMETLRTCETHKDRSTLILGMIDYWEKGETPNIPKKLQDKWRFLYNSLKSSRRNAYAKLGETIAEKEKEILGYSSESSGIEVKNSIDKQSVKPNSYAQPGHAESTYRVENSELKKKKVKNKTEVKRIKEDSDSTDGDRHNYPYPHDPYDEIWKEIVEEERLEANGTFNAPTDHQPLPSPYPHDPFDEVWKETVEEERLKANRTLNAPTPHKPSPSVVSGGNTNSSTTNNNRLPSIFNTVSAGGTSSGSQTSQSGSSNLSTVNEDTKRTSEEVYRRILRKYRIEGKPVSYTRIMAFEELGIERDVFYDAVRYLQMTGRLSIEKAKMPDGKTINSFTPLFDKTHTPSRRVPRSVFDSLGTEGYYYSIMFKYFDEHPFYRNPAWTLDECLISNKDYIDTAYSILQKTLSGKVSNLRNTMMTYLWLLSSQDDRTYEEISKEIG